MAGPPSAPSRRDRAIIAFAILLVVGVLISNVVVALVTGVWSEADRAGDVGVVAFTVVGALILDRRPGEPIGAICLGVGALYATATTLRLVVVAIDLQPGTVPPLGAAIAYLSSMLSTLAILLSGPLIISRFPGEQKRGLVVCSRMASSGSSASSASWACSGLDRWSSATSSHPESPRQERAAGRHGHDLLARTGRVRRRLFRRRDGPRGSLPRRRARRAGPDPLARGLGHRQLCAVC